MTAEIATGPERSHVVPGTLQETRQIVTMIVAGPREFAPRPGRGRRGTLAVVLDRGRYFAALLTLAKVSY